MVAMATEQPGWQQLFHTLSNKSATNPERLVIYQKLGSELCEVPSDCSLDDIQDDFTNTVAVICGDIKCDDEELALCALYAMGLCLHHQHLVSLLGRDQSSGLLRALCDVVMETTNKNICTRALWCFAKQNLPVEAVEAELPSMLSTIEHGQCRKNLQSMTVEHEALNAIIRLLEVVPVPMANHTGVWAKLIYPLLVHGAHKVRDRAMVAVEMGLPAMMQHQAEFSKNLEDDLKTLLIGELHKLMSAGEESYALRVWGVYIKLLGKTLHRSPLINPLLRIPQQGFRHSSSSVKCTTFGAWKTLIDNFALSPDIIGDHSRVKLIMQVFARLNAKDESLAMAKIDAWWHFLSKLGSKLPLYFEQVCVPLLQFCTGGVVNSVGFTPAKSGARTPTHNKLDKGGFGSPGTPQMNLTANPGSSVATFPMIQRKGFEVIAHFLGTPAEDIDILTPPLSLGALEQCVVTGVPFFVKHASVLIAAVRGSIVSQGDKVADGLLYSVWYALVAHVKNVLDTAAKRDGVDVFVCFLENLRQIVHSDTLAADKILKLLQAVLCLPARTLVSAAYSTGGTTEVMQNCPALVLMDLLLHRSIVDSNSSHQRFFSLLEKLVFCGFSHGCSALDFSQVALQLIDRAASYSQNKDALWQMWAAIVQPVKEHITKTSDVNQGDRLEHNFSCLYAVLMFPVQHLLPFRMLQSMQKSLMKTWTELCNMFARLAAMVINAEANIWVEELCSKIYDILPLIDHQGAQCVDSLLQVCLAVIGDIDFSAPVSHGLLTAKNHHLGPNPTSFGRWKQKPLGNLHSVVRLVGQLVGILCQLIQQPQADSETKKTPNSAFQPPALTAINALNSLFSNVSVSTVITDMIARLAPSMSALYTIAMKRSSQKVFSAAVLEKLDSLWATFAAMMKTRFTGIHDSELLLQMAPLFEVGFTHPRKLIKNQTISLWNTTFGQGAPLKYPDTLKPVIAKVQRTATLLLPGWDGTNVTQDYDITFSEVTQGESQSVLPNIIGFPSPLKGCGSFLHKTVSPNIRKSPLPTSPSPCQQRAATARRKLPLIDDRRKEDDFVVIAELPKKKQVLTEHQKEVKRQRRVLPVMYNNLDASQDTQLDSLDDTQMTSWDSESNAAIVMPTSEMLAPPPLQSVKPCDTQVMKAASGGKKEISTEETTKKPVGRRKMIRWALDKNSNIPFDDQPKDGLRDLPKRDVVKVNEAKRLESPGANSQRTQSSACAVAMETDIEHLDSISHSNKDILQVSVYAVTSLEVKTDSHQMQPHSEKKVEVRTFVRRTRSFTRAISTSSPSKVLSPRKQSLLATKTESPRKQSLSPTKTASPRKRSLSPKKTESPRKRLLSPAKASGLRQCSRSPIKTCHLQEKLDHWLIKSCDDKTTDEQNSPQSLTQTVSTDCRKELKDVSSKQKNVTDKGLLEKIVVTGNIKDLNETDLGSFSEDDGEVDLSSQKSSQTGVGVALSPARVPVVQLHKLSAQEIQSFSPKKNMSKTNGHSDPFAAQESRMVDRSRESDDTDSDQSALSEDLFAQSQNSVGIETGFRLRNARDQCPEMLMPVADVDKVNTDSDLFGELKVTKENESTTDHLSLSEIDQLRNDSDVVKNTAASGCDLGSRSRQRRPPGWLKDMECSPVSPRSRERANQRTAQQSPLVEKTASIKSIDFSQGGRAGRHKKTSLKFAVGSCAVNGGKSDRETESVRNEEFGQSLEMDSIATETEIAMDVRESTPVEMDGETTSDGIDETSAATVNEDTPQSAPSSVDCGKRNSSKQAKKMGASLGNRTKIKAKVLNTIFSKQCNLDVESSDEEDVPLSVLNETTDGASPGHESMDDLPLSQVVQTIHKEKCSSDAKITDSDCESFSNQDSMSMFTATVGVELGSVSTETAGVGLGSVSTETAGVGLGSVSTETAGVGLGSVSTETAGVGLGSVSTETAGVGLGSVSTETVNVDLRSVSSETVGVDLGSVSTETVSSGTVKNHLTKVMVLETAMPPDVTTKAVGQARVKCYKKQSAVEKLDSQLGITMTSPVRKCLRSNKCAKLFKPRSISSLENVRRKRLRNVSRKRKRESGDHHRRSMSVETESEAAVCHQDSDAVSECVAQDGSTSEELTVPVDDTVETLDKKDKTCDMAVREKEGEVETGTPTKHKQSVDSKDPDVDRKASLAMSRASLILHRARLMMLGNKPSPGNSEVVVMAMEGDKAKPQLPRCVGILKPSRPRECSTTDRGNQSPPSQFRPVQLPCVYSPSASPSAGILKKQRLSTNTPNESPSPKSPIKKRRRVSFADSVQTVEFRRHATRMRPGRRNSPRGVNRCLEIPRQRKSPLTTHRLWGARHKPATDSASSDTSVDTEPLNSVDPVFPTLLDCDIRVEHVLPQLTSSLWVRGLEQLVRARKLRTVGDLSGLTETEVNHLPIRSPKVLTLRKALQSFSDSKTGLGAKSAGVELADRELGKDAGLECSQEIPNSPEKQCVLTSENEEVEPLVLTTKACPDKLDSASDMLVASLPDEARLSPSKELGLTSPSKGELPCVEDELAKLSPIKKGDLDSSLEYSILLTEISGGIVDDSEAPAPLNPQTEHDTEMEIFSSNDTVLNSTNDAEVVAMDINGLKERLVSTDLTQLGSHDLVKVHEQLNSMMASVVLALKAKCCTSPTRTGNSQ